MSSKYMALTTYLQEYPNDKCKLTFDEIEEILGFELPNVAYDYSSVFWNNANQHYALHWLRSGWIVSQYNMQGRFAVFTRNKEESQRNIDVCNNKWQGFEQSTSVNVHPWHVTHPQISCERLISAGEKYLDDLSVDKHARYLSWEHCYGFFQNNRHNRSPENFDHMCLHLAWYLASWGMLRGGSFLLQKDYLVHMPTVELLTSDEYAELYGLGIQDLVNSSIADKIGKLADEIAEVYRRATITKGQSEGKIATDTLLTKILLGTLGCVPAYDRYFKMGLAMSGISNQRFCPKALTALANYYVENEDAFEALRKKASNNKVEYTPMKVIDMCFWQLAYDDEVATNAQQKVNG